MRRILFALSLLMVVACAMAVPAKPGLWKMLKLEDGTEVRAMLCGDEHGHFWRTADGTAYQSVGEDLFRAVDVAAVVEKAKARRQQVNAKRTMRAPRRALGTTTSYLGTKKAIILLVNFSDKKFQTANNNALYQRIANEEGYSEGQFKGSMADYFKKQSLGKFELDFDIIGPVTVANKMSYYGSNDSDGNDKHPGEMVIEAVNLAMDQVSDWKQYDWDDDGYVDQIYVVYAGKGEADGGSTSTIWPHAYDLESSEYYGDGTGPVTVATGLKVNTYACGAELNGQTSKIAGIGTMCHEFSHCLGYPDFYDIDYSGGQGMCIWDLMDSGSYNDDGYQPAGYTSYERWVAGWVEPTVLEDEDVTVSNMKSLQSSGESYIIYNKHNRNEFFLLENRQFDGWDASLYGKGLLILHVDYNASVWENNQPNDDPNHQRMTWIPADKKYQYQTYQGTKYYDVDGIENDPFPYSNTNAFNKDFGNMAKLYNKNSDNTYYLNSSVEEIKQNSDGTISFKFVADYTGSGSGQGGDDPYVKPTVEGALFYESFDQCDGTGGNDGEWSGRIAQSEFLTDNSGWSSESAWGASECAKFGSSTKDGSVTMPAFTLNGQTTLTFRAGGWNSTKDDVVLNLSATGGTVSPSSVTMNRGSFKDFEVSLTGNGSVRIKFAAKKGRFFLDEVVVMDNGLNAIETVKADNARLNRIYTLDGRYVGQDKNLLPRGIYVINGKKVVR